MRQRCTLIFSARVKLGFLGSNRAIFYLQSRPNQSEDKLHPVEKLSSGQTVISWTTRSENIYVNHHFTVHKTRAARIKARQTNLSSISSANYIWDGMVY